MRSSRLSLAPRAAATLTVAVFAALMAGAPGPSLAQSQPAGETAPAQEALKQVPLTEAQVQHFLAAKKDMDAVLDALPDSAAGQPDPATQAKLDAIAKKNGFATGADYDQVDGNIELVMAGIDPQTKKYVGAESLIKAQMAQIQADKAMKAKDKSDALQQLGDALKGAVPVQNPANIELVTKYYDKLNAALSQD